MKSTTPSDIRKPPTIYDMNLSTHLHPDVFPTMTNIKAAMPVPHDTSLETKMDNARDDVLKLTWEPALSENSAPITVGLATSICEEGVCKIKEPSYCQPSHGKQRRDSLRSKGHCVKYFIV